MRTEQEQRIEKALDGLISNPMINVVIVTIERAYDGNRNDNKYVTKAVRCEWRVELMLVETDGNYLDEWAEAIVKAEELCDKITQDAGHELSHPDFVKAMIAKKFHSTTDMSSFHV